MVTFIIPCRNAAANLPDLAASLRVQGDAGWKAIFIDDCSIDGTTSVMDEIAATDARFSVVKNAERLFALRNIVTVASDCKGPVAIIDGDDQLCNDEVVRLVKDAHDREGVVAWTAHRWDINGLNVSRPMPENVNPYQHVWSSSHLKTFDAGLLARVPIENFKDHRGLWFERGYDQALMLPLLRVASTRRYVPDVCYLYRIKSCSVDDRDWAEKKQLATVNFVRARGFVS